MNLTWVSIGLVLIAAGTLITGLGWNWDKWHKKSVEDSRTIKTTGNYSPGIVNGNYIINGQDIDQNSSRPYVGVRTMDKELKNNILEYRVVFSNTGKLPAILQKTEVEGFSPDMKESKILSSHESHTHLLPGEIIEQDLFRLVGEKAIKTEYKIKLTIIYHAPDNKKTFKTYYLYHYHGSPDLRVGIIDSGIE